MHRQQPICTDNYGAEVYKCRFTGDLVSGDAAQTVGPFIAGVDAVYVMGTGAKAKAAMKVSRANFDESEANCNTCKHLDRVNKGKVAGGFLYGKCKARKQLGVMQFHPNDPMHMECWQARE